MTGTTLLWYTVAMLAIGLAGGIVIGVAIDRDKVYNQVYKRLKIKRGTGDIVIDADQVEERKGLFQRIRERREKRKNP